MSRTLIYSTSSLLCALGAGWFVAAPSPAHALFQRGCTAYSQVEGFAYLKSGERVKFSFRTGRKVTRRRSAWLADQARSMACRDAAKNAAWVARRDGPERLRKRACLYAQSQFRNFSGRLYQVTTVGVAPRKQVTRAATAKGGRVEWLAFDHRCAFVRAASSDRRRSLGRASVVEVAIKTGRDDLRGNSRAYLRVCAKKVGCRRTELNKGRRWRDGSLKRIQVRMPRGVAFEDVTRISIETEMSAPKPIFGGTDTGDNWNVDWVCVSAFNASTRVFYAQRSGYPLYRFRADSWRLRATNGRMREKSKRAKYLLPLPYPRRVRGRDACA